MNNNEVTNEQKQQEATVTVPREYVLEGIGESVEEMHRMMAEARVKCGKSYNTKNEYEVCLRRYNLDDHEATLREYDLIRAKQSRLPSAIRAVIKQHGDNAMRYAYRKILLERKQEAEGTKSAEQ